LRTSRRASFSRVYAIALFLFLSLSYIYIYHRFMRSFFLHFLSVCASLEWYTQSHSYTHSHRC
jgi:uncharacterized membrane protein